MAEPLAAVAPSPRRLRIWPALLIVGAYWSFQLVLAQLDVTLFGRFMSTALSSAAMLLLFIILWLANGTIPWKARGAGLGLFLAGAGAGLALAHRSFEPMGFLMSSVPYALTAWAAWMFVSRRRRVGLPLWALAGLIGLVFGLFDLVRWDGLDGRLRSSVSWRWAPTAEQAFLESRSSAARVPSAATRAWNQRSDDWPGFRGKGRDGVARGVRIDPDWKDAPPQAVWKGRVGPGWSSMIVVDGFLVTQEQRGEKEAVVCYDAASGKEVWTHEDSTRFAEGISGPGPRATPTYWEGRIYALGASGLLTCLDSTTGRPIWKRDLAREASAPAPQWGCAASPLVTEGRVIVFIGGTGARGTVALDAVTGAPVWSRLSGKESYSSAQLITLLGVPQVLVHDNEKLTSLSPKDGSLLWERPGREGPVIPMLQPQRVGEGRLLVSAGAGLALLDLNEEKGVWKVAEEWLSTRFRPSFSDFVVHEGHIYGLDGGVLACADLKTGERIWKKGRYGSGQVLLLADQGLLVVVSEKGELALVPARPQEPEDAIRIPAIDGKTWNHLALAQDRLFVRNGTEIACYRLRGSKTP